jgi:HSP20 family protein
MTFYITPHHPYRMARRWLQAQDCQPEYEFTLAVNAREEDDAFVLSALVPGLKAEDLNIQVLENAVTISGDFKADESEYLLHELPHGSFRRTLRLAVPIEADKAEAHINDGVLTLRLPKAETARPKTVKIDVK